MALGITDAVQDQERAVLTWIKAAAMEGVGLLKKEPSYTTMAKAIDYVEGRQLSLRSKTISKIIDNRLKKIQLETVSAMTEVRQVWDYRTYVNDYKPQAEILNKLVQAWWLNNFCDIRLQDALKFATVGGTGYISPIWNPDIGGGGDIELVVLDPRDVVPIRPAYPYVGSIQEWRGVIIRQKKTVNWLRNKYPHKAYMIGNKTENWFADEVRGSSGSAMGQIQTTVDVLFRTSPERGSTDLPFVDFIRVFIKDETIHTGVTPKLMGKPGTNWAYMVYPVGSINPITGQKVTEDEARLYPRGRLILCTPDCVLEDIPSPYWHGMFPLVKLTLDPMPWSLLGSSLVGDLIPLQDGLNEALRGIEDGVARWLKPNVVADKNAISRAFAEKFDPRKGGQVMMVNPTAGEGLKVLDGPAPEVFDSYFKVVEWLKNEIDDNSGVQGLRELAQLKQMPSSSTVEQYLESQSPLLQIRGRIMEKALGELAEQVKVLIFQYYDAARRVQVLGDDGITLEDFDYDPGTLVPALHPGDMGYLPELDVNLSRVERAEKFHKNFTFYVTQNSMLNVSHMQQKLLYLQLLRIGLLDPWTALEAFDVPNLGTPPKGSVFERMLVARNLGILPGGAPGQGASPTPQGGRPPTAQQPPQFQQKTDSTGAPRMVVSESGG